MISSFTLPVLQYVQFCTHSCSHKAQGSLWVPLVWDIQELTASVPSEEGGRWEHVLLSLNWRDIRATYWIAGNLLSIPLHKYGSNKCLLSFSFVNISSLPLLIKLCFVLESYPGARWQILFRGESLVAESWNIWRWSCCMTVLVKKKYAYCCLEDCCTLHCRGKAADVREAAAVHAEPTAVLWVVFLKQGEAPPSLPQCQNGQVHHAAAGYLNRHGLSWQPHLVAQTRCVPRKIQPSQAQAHTCAGHVSVSCGLTPVSN